MQENMLNDMTKEILKDIGIVAVGDMLLILRHAKKVGLFVNPVFIVFPPCTFKLWKITAF